MTRHEIREAEFLLLFEKTFREDEQLKDIITQHETDYEYRCEEEVEKTVEDVIEKIPELDAVIEKYSQSRSVKRIPRVNLSVLRLAIYEINYRADKVPVNAAVNEAVGLVKAYAQDTDVKFVNGVLGAYTRDLKNKTGEKNV